MEIKTINNKPKPIISWWKSGDPNYKLDLLRNQLTDINIINTKNLSDEFINICLEEKNRIFLHINITGMAKTIFEPNIQTIREVFFQLKKLIDSGFPQKQILVIVNPIIPNENGLKSLKLLLRLFTEFKELRLRFIRFNVLSYGKNSEINNTNIAKRLNSNIAKKYLFTTESFWKDYYKLIDEYKSIISIDKGDEYLIGIRELIPFGYKNEWFNSNGEREKLITYENGNKYKPMLNVISGKTVRCKNRCLLCSWFG